MLEGKAAGLTGEARLGNKVEKHGGLPVLGLSPSEV